MKMIKSMFTIFIFFLIITAVSACSEYDSALSQAQEELPFPVLVSPELPEGWSLDETIYEDRLLVSVFSNNNEGRIELIQDRNIQGLDMEALSEFLLSDHSLLPDMNGDPDKLEASDFVGEMAYFVEPVPTVQYTFVHKKDLFSDMPGNVPIYQVIGTNISTNELTEFVETLEAST